MFWDNEPTPSVECPLGDFFGASFAAPRRFVADRLTISGGGYLSRLEMPFGERAVIEVENQSKRTLRLLVYQIGYYEEDCPPGPLQTLHVQWRRQNPTLHGQPFVALEARGAGELIGVKVDLQNRSWWLRPPLRHIFFPRGLGLGMLEGAETIEIDGDGARRALGTGTEDFFHGGWYFLGGAFQTPTHGATRRSFLTGRVSAYRFLVGDQIPFEQSLRLAFDHGIDNDIATDYASVVYWYQQEPHHEFPSLPPVRERRPAVPALNIAQPLLALALLASLVALVVSLLLRA